MGEGGFQHLLAGARANVGVKSGRYMFEVKMLELLQPEERTQGHPHKVKVGFATAKSSLFLGDDEDSICFEIGGNFQHNKKSTRVTKVWSRDATMALVLNLDKKSANFNTVSLFGDGVRLCQPQALPEALKGKTLFPAVTFRNATLHMHFGPEPVAPLPFSCHMIEGMEKANAEVAAAPEAPKDGKYEVLYPVGLPHEGAFNWLDMFLEENPKYTELSDRSLVAWAQKSGIAVQGGFQSLDTPHVTFGVPTLDDFSCRRILASVASLQQRDYVVMSLAGNLTKEGRQAALDRF